MRRDLHRGYHRARIWLGGLPAATYQPKRVVERNVPVGGARPGAPTRVAAEAFIVREPRHFYGLLGAEYAPTGADSLLIRVGITGYDGPVYADSLVPGRWPADAHVGLPPEYAEAVIEGLCTPVDDAPRLCGGTLLVACASHGLVGSAHAVFGRPGADARVRARHPRAGSLG